jgi:hypothetical protein
LSNRRRIFLEKAAKKYPATAEPSAIRSPGCRKPSNQERQNRSPGCRKPPTRNGKTARLVAGNQATRNGKTARLVERKKKRKPRSIDRVSVGWLIYVGKKRLADPVNYSGSLRRAANQRIEKSKTVAGSAVGASGVYRPRGTAQPLPVQPFFISAGRGDLAAFSAIGEYKTKKLKSGEQNKQQNRAIT